MVERLRAHSGLVAVVGLYYFGFLTLGLTTGNSQVPYYAAFMAVLLGLVSFWDARRQFSSLVLWGLALWGALHMAGGMIPVSGGRVLYNVWLLPFVRFDHLVHAIGFGFAGLAFWESVRPTVDRNVASGAAITMMGGFGFGALNEMVEFLITRSSPTPTSVSSRTPAGIWSPIRSALCWRLSGCGDDGTPGKTRSPRRPAALRNQSRQKVDDLLQDLRCLDRVGRGGLDCRTVHLGGHFVEEEVTAHTVRRQVTL